MFMYATTVRTTLRAANDSVHKPAMPQVTSFFCMQLWEYAYAICITGYGGEPNYDGGCQLARSYVSGYAETSFEAIQAVLAAISFGSTGCNCSGFSAAEFAEAIASEAKVVFASLEGEMQSRFCNPDNYGMYNATDVWRDCISRSTADSIVKAIANVSTQGGCVTSYRADVCEKQDGQCQGYWGEDGWTSCVDVRASLLSALAVPL